MVTLRRKRRVRSMECSGSARRSFSGVRGTRRPRIRELKADREEELLRSAGSQICPRLRRRADRRRAALLVSETEVRAKGEVYLFCQGRKKKGNIKMKFRLIQKSINRAIAKFHVLSGEDIVGSITVPSEQVPDLLRHWHGEKQLSSSLRMSASVPTVKLAKPRRMSRAAILRGCL